MKVYALLFHEPWELSDPGPEDVSISGIYQTREAAQQAAYLRADWEPPIPLKDEDEAYPLEDTRDFYTIEEHELK
jgi:hypothetical protein